MYCDAVTPDGRRLHFDDVIATGDVVVNECTGEPFLVGLDRGSEYPLLHPIGTDEWNAYQAELHRKSEARRRELYALGAKS